MYAQNKAKYHYLILKKDNVHYQHLHHRGAHITAATIPGLAPEEGSADRRGHTAGTKRE